MLLFKKALFPLKAGKLEVTPLEAEATTLENAFNINASSMRKSKPLTVEVLPLPVAGRPAQFEPSNIGQFELIGTVDRTQLKAGEAVTWKLTVRGANGGTLEFTGAVTLTGATAFIDNTIAVLISNSIDGTSTFSKDGGAGPMTFATLIIATALLPLFTMTGVSGVIFAPMAFTYAFAIGGAIVMALTLTPVLTSRLIPAQGEEKMSDAQIDALFSTK